MKGAQWPTVDGRLLQFVCGVENKVGYIDFHHWSSKSNVSTHLSQAENALCSTCIQIFGSLSFIWRWWNPCWRRDCAGDILIALVSVLKWHRHLQHEVSQRRGEHCLPYQIYFNSKDVQRPDVIFFSYGTGPPIIARRKQGNAADVENKVTAT